MRGRRGSGAVLAVALIGLAGLAACSSDEGASPPERTTTTAAFEPAPPDEPVGCPVDRCTLQAAAPDDLLVGTAAKFGDPDREALQLQEFEAVTAEGEFLFASIHPERDRWDFERADRLVAYAEEHDLDLTATHFLWDPPSIPWVLPDWVRAIDDPDELRAVLREHFEVLHDRYGGKIDRWNVVNEPLDLDGTLAPNHFAQVLGPDYVAWAFEVAEEVWPEAQLVLNQDSTEYLGDRAVAYVELADNLLEGGARVDRVGLQGHLMLGEPNWPLVEQTVGDLAALGVTVDLTEIDVPLQGMNASAPAIDEEEQADWAARFVRICLDEPACGSITFWGFDDGDTWLDDFIRPGTDPLLFDEDLQPKPMYQAVRNELLAGRG